MKITSKLREYLKMNLNHFTNSLVINRIDSNIRFKELISKKNLHNKNLEELILNGYSYYNEFLPEKLNELIVNNFKNENTFFFEKLNRSVSFCARSMVL